MTYEQLEILIKAVFVFVSLVVTLIIKPLIESKVSTVELEKLENYIKVGVRCAEQIYTPEQWKEKKNYVTNYVQGLLEEKIDLKLTEQQIDTLIEGCVNLVKKG